MNAKRIGYHVSGDFIDAVDFAKSKGVEVVQTFSGSPRKYTNPDLSKFTGVSIDAVIHSPYWVNLCKPQTEKAYQTTLKYTIAISFEMSKYGIKRYVTHIGGRGDYGVKYSLKSIYDFCLRWLYATKGQDTILCLENDAGSKNDTKMGKLAALYTVVSEINNPRIKICFDSEHAYADGFDLNNIKVMEMMKPYVGVVHWNSIPQNVVKGGHLDRHSSTLLKDCKEGENYIKNVYNVFYNDWIPFILERERDIALQDLEWIRKS